jgi:hypothetical protein
MIVHDMIFRLFMFRRMLVPFAGPLRRTAPANFKEASRKVSGFWRKTENDEPRITPKARKIAWLGDIPAMLSLRMIAFVSDKAPCYRSNHGLGIRQTSSKPEPFPAPEN